MLDTSEDTEEREGICGGRSAGWIVWSVPSWERYAALAAALVSSEGFREEKECGVEGEGMESSDIEEAVYFLDAHRATMLASFSLGAGLSRGAGDSAWSRWEAIVAVAVHLVGRSSLWIKAGC